MPKKKDTEFDLHIWKHAETSNMAALYTVSIGKRAICYSVPIEYAIECIREEMESDS